MARKRATKRAVKRVRKPAAKAPPAPKPPSAVLCTRCQTRGHKVALELHGGMHRCVHCGHTQYA